MAPAASHDIGILTPMFAAILGVMLRHRYRGASLSLFALGCLAAGGAQACYTVLDAGGTVVWRATKAPRRASQAVTVPEGGRVLINGAPCSALRARVDMDGNAGVPRATVGAAPLLTDVDTAAAAHVRYERVSGEIAVVPPAMAEQAWQRADRRELTASSHPDQAELNATAGPPDDELVITEWADGRTEVHRQPRHCTGLGRCEQKVRCAGGFGRERRCSRVECFRLTSRARLFDRPSSHVRRLSKRRVGLRASCLARRGLNPGHLE